MSATEMIVGLVILFLTFGIMAAFVYDVVTDRNGASEAAESAYETPPKAESPFPEPDAAGWRRPQRIFRYSRENLYVKIDGRAPVYLDSGVMGLTFGTYSDESEPRHSVEVYWYDMRTPASALGVYRAEAPPGAEQVAIGEEGYEVGGAIFFRAGANYVQVLPGNLDETEERVALGIAERLAARIGRGSQSPQESENGK